MSSMKLSTLFCIFKKLNLKKSVNVRHYSKTQERTRASVGAVTTRRKPLPPTPWGHVHPGKPRLALALVTEQQAWPVCIALSQCRQVMLVGYRTTSMTCLHWLKAMRVFGVKRMFVRMGGEAPLWALYLCRSPSLWTVRAWCWARPVLPTHSPGRRPRCQPLQPLPGRLPRRVCPRAGGFYKEKEHIKKQKRQDDYIATCCN